MTSGKRSWMLVAGIVAMLAGFLAAAGLWYSAGARESDAVSGLARAPLGCDTTLDFEATGEFLLFVETRGSFDADTTGDCEPGDDYDRAADDLPVVTLTLTDPSGADVALDTRTGVSYSNDSSAGNSIRKFTVDTPGDHVLRVEAPDGDTGFAVSVGRDPSDGVATLRLGALLAGIGGLVVGGLLLILAKRKRPDVVSAVPEWPPAGGGWVTAPPGMPQAPPSAMPGPPAGPPTYAPSVPPGFTGPPSIPGQPPLPQPPSISPPPAPIAPPAPRPAPRPAPQPGAPPPSWQPGPAPAQDPNFPSWAPRPAPNDIGRDGSSGDGEHSPWAPPSDPAR